MFCRLGSHPYTLLHSNPPNLTSDSKVRKQSSAITPQPIPSCSLGERRNINIRQRAWAYEPRFRRHQLSLRAPVKCCFPKLELFKSTLQALGWVLTSLWCRSNFLWETNKIKIDLVPRAISNIHYLNRLLNLVRGKRNGTKSGVRTATLKEETN